MASGLDGQRFAFHGYAPVDPAERARQLRAWEQHSARHDQTQILIETPTATAPCSPPCWRRCVPTPACASRALTTGDELVQTRTIADWKRQPAPELDKKPTLFLFLAR